jgi:hypothetical protein
MKLILNSISVLVSDPDFNLVPYILNFFIYFLSYVWNLNIKFKQNYDVYFFYKELFVTHKITADI